MCGRIGVEGVERLLNQMQVGANDLTALLSELASERQFALCMRVFDWALVSA